MADGTKIEWTDATWNPITGCSLASPGCTNCYAMQLAGTRLSGHPSRKGLTLDTKSGPVWTGEVRLNRAWLDAPLRWKRPRRVFVCAHGDLFHESVPDAWIDAVFAIMALAPQHSFQILTKRAERMRTYMSGRPGKLARFMIDEYLIDGKANGYIVRADWPVSSIGSIDAPEDVTMRQWPLPNVWLGVSVEDQKRAEERIQHLLETPAAVRWISAEPLLGPIDLNCLTLSGDGEMDAVHPWSWEQEEANWVDTSDAWETDFEDHFGHEPGAKRGPMHPVLDWVVVGGESGANARPMHPYWARALRDQCAAAGVAFLFKQWGQWAPICEMSEEAVDACFDPPPAHSPDASRRLRVDQCVLHGDGRRFDGRAMYERPAFEQGSHAMTMMAIGKKAAGRLLDAIEHNAFPQAAT